MADLITIDEVKKALPPNLRSWARHKLSVYRNETFWNYVINDVYVFNCKSTDGWGLPAR